MRLQKTFFQKRVKRLPVSDRGARRLVNRPDTECKVFHQAQFGHATKGSFEETVDMAGSQVHVLRNAVLFPGQVIVDNNAIHPFTFRLENYSESTKHLKVRQTPDGPRFKMSRSDWPPISATLPRGFLIDTEWIDEYGHLVFEALSQTWPLLEEIVPKDVPIITSGRQGWLLGQFLDYLGLADRPIIHISRGVKVKELIVASQAYVLFKGYTPEAPQIYDRIRSRFLNREAPARIYLSRRHFPTRVGRKLVNETEIGSILTRERFETIFPEKLKLEDQLTLFANARFIAGESGTAMLNRVFSQSDTKELLFGTEYGIESNHAIIRSMLGFPHELSAVVNGWAPDGDMGPDPATWMVDPGSVLSALSQLEKL